MHHPAGSLRPWPPGEGGSPFAAEERELSSQRRLGDTAPATHLLGCHSTRTSATCPSRRRPGRRGVRVTGHGVGLHSPRSLAVTVSPAEALRVTQSTGSRGGSALLEVRVSPRATSESTAGPTPRVAAGPGGSQVRSQPPLGAVAALREFESLRLGCQVAGRDPVSVTCDQRGPGPAGRLERRRRWPAAAAIRWRAISTTIAKSLRRDSNARPWASAIYLS